MTSNPSLSGISPHSARSICVFCGSKTGTKPVFEASALRLGTVLAQSGRTLVYGGGGIGLMGAVAQACLDHNGRVVGIIPDVLRHAEVSNLPITQTIVTRSMHERKKIMFDKSDAFVVLPGGIGTLEELVEVASWRYLDFHFKPIVLLDIEDYWKPLRQLLAHFDNQGFVRADAFHENGGKQLLYFVKTVEEILPAVDQALSFVIRPEKRKVSETF